MGYVVHFQTGIKLVPWGLIFLLCQVPTAYAVTSTEILPAGVRALALVYANAPSVDSSLDSTGRLQSLAHPLNRSVTLNDLEAAEPRLKVLKKVLNAYAPGMGLGEKILVSNFYSDVRVEEKRYVLGLLWGISTSFSAGFILPYIDREISASFRSETVNNASQIREIVGTATPQVAEALRQIEDMRFDTAFYEQKLFTENGYKFPRSYRVKGFGDLEIEARAKYFESDILNLGLRGNVKLPTASHKADISNLLDRDFGDRTIAMRLGSVHTVKLVQQRLNFQSGVFGTWRAPNRQTVAVPRSPQEALANLNDPYQVEELERRLGAQLDIDAGFNLDFARGALSLFSSYVFTVKEKDSYAGGRTLDYARLSAGTDSKSHVIESGVELSSVPLFLEKVWPVPAKVTATWVQPVGGENSLNAKYGRLDAILFF